MNDRALFTVHGTNVEEIREKAEETLLSLGVGWDYSLHVTPAVVAFGGEVKSWQAEVEAVA